MVPMKMGDEYRPDLHEREGGKHQLTLRSLAAVHEDYVGTAPDGYARCRMLFGRDGRARPEE